MNGLKVIGDSKGRGTRKERVLTILPHSCRRRWIFKHEGVQVVVQEPLEVSNGHEFILQPAHIMRALVQDMLPHFQVHPAMSTGVGFCREEGQPIFPDRGMCHDSSNCPCGEEQ
jgi:hypothetical protein